MRFQITMQLDIEAPDIQLAQAVVTNTMIRAVQEGKNNVQPTQPTQVINAWRITKVNE